MTEIPILGTKSVRSARRAWVISAPSPLMLTVALLLTFGLLMLIISLVVSLRLGDMMARPNPFTSYDAIWPGQTITNMAEFAVRAPTWYERCYTESFGTGYPGQRITVTYDTHPPPPNMTCDSSADNGVFRNIGILFKDNRIQELDLFSDVLAEDTLFLFWGAPDAISEGEIGKTIYLHWDRNTYTATATVTKPYSVVNLITLVAK